MKRYASVTGMFVAVAQALQLLKYYSFHNWASRRRIQRNAVKALSQDFRSLFQNLRFKWRENTFSPRDSLVVFGYCRRLNTNQPKFSVNLCTGCIEFVS